MKPVAGNPRRAVTGRGLGELVLIVIAVGALVQAENIFRRHRRTPRQRGVLAENIGHAVAREEIIVELVIERAHVILLAHVRAADIGHHVDKGLRRIVEKDAAGERRAGERAGRGGIGLHQQRDGAIERLSRVQRAGGAEGRAAITEIIEIEVSEAETVLHGLRPRLFSASEVKSAGRHILHHRDHFLIRDVKDALAGRVAMQQLARGAADHGDRERRQAHFDPDGSGVDKQLGSARVRRGDVQAVQTQVAGGDGNRVLGGVHGPGRGVEPQPEGTRAQHGEQQGAGAEMQCEVGSGGVGYNAVDIADRAPGRCAGRETVYGN